MKILKILIALLLVMSPVFANPTLDEMTGQMILVGFQGDSANSKQYKTILKQLEKGQITGVILFEHNVKDPVELLKMTKGIRYAKAKYTPFISLDQEGGRIQILREKNGFVDYLSPKDVSSALNLKEAYMMYDEMAKTDKAYGFNVSYVPCVDLILSENSIINQKSRAFSKDPKIVEKYAKEVLKSHYKNNIITSLKHFPGHGSAVGDTHLGFVDASKNWNEIELLPYSKLINSNDLQMVMVTHVFVKQLDEKYPASLSNKIITELLRNKMGYKGVVITDDLHMDAIRKQYTLEETVIEGINAGNDILMFSNFDYPDMKTPEKVQKIIKKAVKEGKIDKKQIEQAYERIKKLKSTHENKNKIEKTKNVNYEKIIKKYEDKTPTYWGENAKGVITKIKTDEKIVAITLDACGSKTDSLDENLIDFLIKEEIPATMFINKRWIKKYPQQFKKLSNNPLFEIENHGANHLPASINGKSIYNIEGTKNIQELIKEVDENGEYIKSLTGKKPIYFRSGTAFYDEYAVKIIYELGYKPIGFSILGDRGATYTAKEVEHAFINAKKGDIAIFHMNHPEKQTGMGLIRVIPKLKAKGFTFVKIEDYDRQLY